MSRATRHLEKLLRALQASPSESFESGAVEDALSPCIPPSESSPLDEAGNEEATTLEQETPRSSRFSMGRSTITPPDSEETTTPPGSDGSRVYQEEASRLVQQLGDSRVLVATLEAQVQLLKQEKGDQETQRCLYIHRLEAEVQRLELQAENDMVELLRRQNQVEEEIPGLEQQLTTIKGVLHNFDVSEPVYLELRAIPEERRTARDHILMLAFEKFHKDREEIEELRRSRDTSREALTRANDEVQKLLRESQRLAARHASERRDTEIDLSATNARIERLEAENRDAMVQIELLTAKGSLFDEVEEKLEILERTNIDAENQKAVMAATLQVIVQEKERLLGLLKEKDHTCDLLSMDKIYLSREAQSQTDQVKKLEAELERQHEKLREVKRARTELYNKVLTDNKDNQTANEQRIQAEIMRIHDRTNQDIELIRKEANAVADEKVRTFREMRDAALTDAETSQAELREQKAVYDELLSKYRELQRRTESKETESQNALKMSNFTQDRLKVDLEETRNALDQTRLEKEALVVKLKVLVEKCHALEAHISVQDRKEGLEAPMLELKEELRVTRARLENYENKKAATGATLKIPKQASQTRRPTSNKVIQTDPPKQESVISIRTSQEAGEGSKECWAGVEDREEVQGTQAWPHIQELMGGLPLALQEKPRQVRVTGLPSEISGANIQDQARQGLSVAIRCLELQNAVRALEKANAELKERASAKEEELMEMNNRTRFLQQPQSYLVDAIEIGEVKLKETVQENQELEGHLRNITQEKEKVSKRLHTLEEDIRKLLQARGSIENLQILLQEKGVVIGDKTLKTITASRKVQQVMLQSKKKTSPRRENLQHEVQRGRMPELESQDFQLLIEGASPRCRQHKHCPPHFLKSYSTVLAAITKQANQGRL